MFRRLLSLPLSGPHKPPLRLWRSLMDYKLDMAMDEMANSLAMSLYSTPAGVAHFSQVIGLAEMSKPNA